MCSHNAKQHIMQSRCSYQISSVADVVWHQSKVNCTNKLYPALWLTITHVLRLSLEGTSWVGRRCCCSSGRCPRRHLPGMPSLLAAVFHLSFRLLQAQLVCLPSWLLPLLSRGNGHQGERSLNGHPDPFVELGNWRTDGRNNPHQPNKPSLWAFRPYLRVDALVLVLCLHSKTPV